MPIYRYKTENAFNINAVIILGLACYQSLFVTSLNIFLL